MDVPPDIDDRQVMLQVQAGAVDRFTELVARYRVPLLRVAAGRSTFFCPLCQPEAG